MAKILTAPGKYIQGKGTLKELGKYVGDLGNNVLAICDEFILDSFSKQIKVGLEDEQLRLGKFNGECSRAEIDRLKELAQAEEAEVIIGIGGGKTLDTAKAVSYYTNLPVAIVPTIAATDAPCSALSVIYTEEGVFEEYLFLPSNPNLVIMDTKVIAQAPVEFLIAGIGDALATYFEAEACSVTRVDNIAGGSQTAAALNLAQLCYETLLDYGVTAKKAVEAGGVTEAVEKIVEANTLLSGLGFESGGLAAAHAIHNGFTVLEKTHSKTHGEKVAYSTIVQLVLEDRPPRVIEQVINFCKEVGLPTTLADLGIEQATEEGILEVAKASCVEDETIHNMPFEVTPGLVKDAILAVDKLSR
ncbi:glycerol dehydrogenase-like oxidoreductase [Halobacteroides halobius DSM 5150]|uniref:Glycerol dehydrogenase n=1 Tax=Halobacteroides halobius (strain ATCC 35273 / DSM 5150 / MD-1) TaxID=748449 RepID=L0KAF2_HALHC|nr:glycerol dehydrogenase [Halobacteroides halobius]AGB41083.1 glycerol dehydrogenase-like oxidoreductase [Halobacteroides halobius DSM 5150]